MSEWDPLSEQEEDFINYVRTKRGPCPDNDTLVAYHDQSLLPDQGQEIEAHVRLCGSCQVAIEMLERFDACVRGELPEPPDWPEVEKRGRERFAAFLESVGPGESAGSIDPVGSIKSVDSAGRRGVSRERKSSFWDKVRGVLLHPALAYVLLATLAYPAYRGLFLQPEMVTKVVPQKEMVEVAKPALEIATLPRFELKSPQRADRRALPTVQLSSDEPFFALSFFVPVSERPEFLYEVEIRDSEGRLIAMEKTARPEDMLGNFLLVCRRELFSPGAYELQVKEVNKTMQELGREFSFRFTVSVGDSSLEEEQ